MDKKSLYGVIETLGRAAPVNHDVLPKAIPVITGVRGGGGMVPLEAVLHNPPGSIGGRQPANTTMRSHMVVVVAPEPQHRAGMAERHEQRLVEAFVTQAAVEALDLAVLLRLARRDVVLLDWALLRPYQDHQADQLGAVVADDHQRRYASGRDDGVELSSDAYA